MQSIEGTNLVWKQHLNVFDQFFVRVSPSWQSISLDLVLARLMTDSDTVQFCSNTVVVRNDGVILSNTKLALKPPATACMQRASPFWWNPSQYATHFRLSRRELPHLFRVGGWDYYRSFVGLGELLVYLTVENYSSLIMEFLKRIIILKFCSGNFSKHLNS